MLNWKLTFLLHEYCCASDIYCMFPLSHNCECQVNRGTFALVLHLLTALKECLSLLIAMQSRITPWSRQTVQSFIKNFTVKWSWALTTSPSPPHNLLKYLWLSLNILHLHSNWRQEEYKVYRICFATHHGTSSWVLSACPHLSAKLPSYEQGSPKQTIDTTIWNHS